MRSHEEKVPAAAIDKAPTELSNSAVSSDEYEKVLSAYSKLQFDFNELVAEHDKLKGSSESARADLIKPYAWAVLKFLSAYGGVVGVILIMQGFHLGGFHINDTVMGVVVGSTAASAIGLVHTVVRGLFPIARA